MDRNLGENVAWITKEKYVSSSGTSALGFGNDKGPLTAIEVLEERTSGWTNIEEYSYNLESDSDGLGGSYKYNSIRRTNVRARLLTYTEAKNLGCKIGEENSCPQYLVENTYNNGDNSNYGYWLSTLNSNSNNHGRMITFKRFVGQNDVYLDNVEGIRPVITIPKSNFSH